MTVLDRIKKISKMRGYNLTKVNDLAHLGKNTIYSWKTKEPSHNNVQAVADVLGVSVDYLLGNTDEMHSVKTERTDATDLNNQPILSFDGEIVSDEAREKILEYAQFVMEQEKGKNGK